MGANDVFAFVLALVGIAAVSLVLIFRGPVGRAIARRLEGGAPGGLIDARVAELEQRLAELEQERHRVGELEDRLDFTERLLSETNERSREAPR